MKRPPAWVPYVVGGGVIAVVGYLIYKKLAVKLPEVGQAVSSTLIDLFHPGGVSNTAQNVQAALPTAPGRLPLSVGVTPAYQAAINGFVAANPQLAPSDVIKRMISVAWKVGDPAPPGLNPY